MDVECGKCGRMVSGERAKVDVANQWYVCEGCLLEAQKEKSRKYEHQKLAEREKQSSKVDVKCDNCGYKYLYDTWKKYPRECPYCGKKPMGMK
jgi:DNA-directed RNA polymerase subunit RPC12/RpoP